MWRIAFAFLLIAAWPSGATPQDSGRLAFVAERVIADPAFQRHYNKFPADIAATEGGFRASDPMDCAAAPVQCWEQCAKGAGGICVDLAYALQHHMDDPRITRDASEMAFARGCALGEGRGCTNRAAGIMNIRGQSLTDRSAKEVTECTFRTFDMTCQIGDAWGCGMLGVHYAEGRGTAANRDKARENFRKACVIAPDSDACLPDFK